MILHPWPGTRYAGISRMAGVPLRHTHRAASSQGGWIWPATPFPLTLMMVFIQVAAVVAARAHRADAFCPAL